MLHETSGELGCHWQVNRDLPLVKTQDEAVRQSQVLHTLVDNAVSAVGKDTMQHDLNFIRRFFPAMRHYMPLYGDVPPGAALDLWNQFHTSHDVTRGVPSQALVHLWETTVGKGYVRTRHVLPAPLTADDTPAGTP